MLEFAYFFMKCIMIIFIAKYITETIQVICTGQKTNEDSLLKMYFKKKFSSSKSWDHEETTHKWKN